MNIKDMYHIISQKIEDFGDRTGVIERPVSPLEIDDDAFVLVVASDTWGVLMHWEFDAPSSETRRAFSKKDFRSLYSAMKYFEPEDSEDGFCPALFSLVIMNQSLEIQSIFSITGEAAIMIAVLLGRVDGFSENLFDYDVELDYDD